MATGWTVSIAAGGGPFTDYTTALPVSFVKRLNGLGFFECMFPGLDGLNVPARDTLIRFTWDKGEASERIHFEGVITNISQLSTGKAYRVRGLSVEGLLWMSTIGAIRSYAALTPHAIIQQAGSPKGLIYNGQGNLRPVGASTLAYGSAADVPLKVDGGTPGTALTFNADSSRALVNIQRLCLQARYDGGSYGLEFLARLESTAGNINPRFYLVKRRNRAAVYTPENATLYTDLFHSTRGKQGLTAAEAIRVVGSGDGRTRVESSLVGSGGLEGIVADKTIVDATGATNMANRLSELLNPSTDVVTGWWHRHAYATEIGDDIVVKQSGVGDATLRVFEIGYNLYRKMFFFVIGRPRPLHEDPFFRIDALAGGQAHGPQKTDLKPRQLSAEGVTTTSTGPDPAVTTADAATSARLCDGAAVGGHANADGYEMRMDVQVNADTDGPLRWEIFHDDTTVIMTHTTGKMKANKTYVYRGFWPWAFADATNFTLRVTNNSGANVTVPVNGCTIQVRAKPRFLMNS